LSVETRKTKAGKTYYLARVKSGGELVASKSFVRKNAAEAWEREQKHLLDTGRPLPPKRSFTLGELVDMFREARKGGNPHTFDTDRDNLAALPKNLLARPLTSIRSDDVRGHLLAELRGGKKPSTVSRAKTTLSALFTFAAEQGLLSQEHPVRTMKKIPELSQSQPSVSPNEIPTPERVASAINDMRARRPDVADVFEFMSLTGVRWGEVRAIRVESLIEAPLAQLSVERSHSDRYAEKDPKSWRGTRPVPLSPRALEIFRAHATGKPPDAYLFTNQLGGQLSVGVVRKFPLGFRRHALRHFAASTWLRLGTPVHEVAEYLGDEARTVLKVYAHVLGEGQRRDFVDRLASAEKKNPAGSSGHLRDTWPKDEGAARKSPGQLKPGMGL
jgi:integrase